MWLADQLRRHTQVLSPASEAVFGGCWHSRIAILTSTVLAICLSWFGGCGTKDSLELHPVSGKVSLDGKPCEGAVVTLIASDEATISRKLDKVPTGYVKSDGSFAIGTNELEDGAPTGKYKVTIFWYPPNAHEIMAKTGNVPNLMPRIYGDPKTTNLEINVAAGRNEVPEFKIASKK